METKYGYCITTTPGLVSDGSYPLAPESILSGTVIEAIGTDCIAVWNSEAAATEAMMRLVPAGSTPATWAGLAVEALYRFDPAKAIHGFGQWMDA